MTTYTPDPVMCRYGIHTCTECGQVPVEHHPDGRCYTTDELVGRLRTFQRTGVWPAAGTTNEEKRDVHPSTSPLRCVWPLRQADGAHRLALRQSVLGRVFWKVGACLSATAAASDS
jgi:hypothetical protein